MEAKELRIGNYLYNGFNEIIKIENIISKNNTSGYLLDTLKPIPLTEEILLKCGFEKVESERWCDMHEEYEECDYYYFDCFKLYYNPELGCYTDDTFEYRIKLEHLHQLQNLYFSLTSEELTINL